MASPDLAAWHVAASTDPGRVRPQNEDSCATFERADGARLLVVADGMGGHRGGATASRLTVDELGRAFAAADAVSDRWLDEAIRDANREVHAVAERDPNLVGMGTTVVAVLAVPDGEAWVAHVGDSRAYRLRDGVLEPLTEDHSVVAEMIRRGVLRPEEAATHPRRNEILRSVGVDATVEPEITAVELRPGDRILLCSDGLCGVVPDDEIGALIAASSPEGAVAAAIEAANELGGPDNITAIVAAVEPPGAGSGSSTALGVLVALVAALGWFAFELWS